MGAVASLMYMKSYKKDPLISALILDSPYSRLKDTIVNFASQNTSLIPEFIISMGVDSVN